MLTACAYAAVIKPGKTGNATYTTLLEAQTDGAVTENYGKFLQVRVAFEYFLCPCL